ncbi:hypothetical protein SAMN05192533_11011 [Mesobacillus persicus]|uniref:Uncharacterized protein n=1 Tax=Mesobacillus persicus TaxID=930146 RepID=A0A1H8EKD4_9BACI|nr:hypothetical protein [Mesobacillus persicus]SEN19850.1 hypothetical protein SAMN05192533_11011 [Mesobacillus persicus]
MGKSSCRYVINAQGKGGETYYTHCKDKAEVKKWIATHEEKLSMKELKIIDKQKHPLLSWLSFKF